MLQANQTGRKCDAIRGEVKPTGRTKATPRYVNSLHQRNVKKPSVNAAQIMEKSLAPNQIWKIGQMPIFYKTWGVTGRHWMWGKSPVAENAP